MADMLDLEKGGESGVLYREIRLTAERTVLVPERATRCIKKAVAERLTKDRCQASLEENKGGEDVVVPQEGEVAGDAER